MDIKHVVFDAQFTEPAKGILIEDWYKTVVNFLTYVVEHDL